jgi:hypothetical protein
MDAQVPAGELPAHGPAIETGNGSHPPRRGSLGAKLKLRRELKQVTGVPFVLKATDPDFDARVRIPNLFERATLAGLPVEIQEIFLRGFNAQDFVPEVGKRALADMLNIMGIEDEMATELSLIGFVRPRLVRTPADLEASNDPEAVCVDDIEMADRKRYLSLVMGQDAAEMARVERFLKDEVARLEDSHADGGGGTAAPTVRFVGDEASGLLAGSTTGL